MNSNGGQQTSLLFKNEAFTPPHSQSFRPLRYSPELPVGRHLQRNISMNTHRVIRRRVTYKKEQNPLSGMQTDRSEPVQF